ncbi:MAG TPA: acetolactate synthase 3 large subunit [Gammaproteobacteria bacterium]|uniref:Acetolactate synthase n=1 Tax=OM182 bacterium TaxID=2510334 RepID=A0A520S1V1_9GAMM|nr:acetolactate synthase 3 large subunit [Gammaproteobacteria bacterium]RZO76434.1 MAG: acetolactate synthase 3 large subunit [OM182 bacterium]HAR91171.1 acetolactate synthase 3 large subunit [Gammaproteobacteria bacterium]
MEQLSGGEALIRALQDEGVEFLFGYPGGAVLHIYDALFRQDHVEHILVRHEQAATHAADGYARATGKPGVVLVTSGPGATNAVTGIATAYMDSIPMVVISGQVESRLIGSDGFQETDMVGVSRPIVKHSFMVQNAADIPKTIKKAFHIATSGRPGPVVIDVPKDVTDPKVKFDYEYPKEIKLRSYQVPSRGHSGQIKKAVEALLGAKCPMIYTGGGVIQGEGCDELIELTRKLGYPITNTLMGLGAYPSTDQQFLGMLGMHGTYEANMAMHYCDVLLAVGARFDDRVTNSDTSKFCPDATILHVDIDPAAISKTVTADVPIVGPVKAVLLEMINQVEKSEQQVDAGALEIWWKQIEKWRERQCLAVTPSVDGTIKPQQAVQALYDITEGDAFISSDVGQHQMFAAQYYGFDKPRRWINSGGLGTMGFGFPAAMGVQFAYPDALSVCVTGEGSFMMNQQEFATCMQYGLPIKIVCLNNEALGMVKQWQDMQYGGRYSHSTYSESLPDFIKLAEAYGHVGVRIEKYDDLHSKLKAALAMKDKLVFIDILVDPSEHVYPMAIKGGAMKDMVLSKTERT